MSTYNNTQEKTILIEKTGSEIIADNYVVDISSLLDTSTTLGSTLSSQDEIVVVRKFAPSVSPDITADEAWSAYTLPNANASGSSMYSISGTQLTFSQTASAYTWTTTMSGRAADVALPVIASADKIYILRKVILSSPLVTFSPSSKITSKNLNLSIQQLINHNQEMYKYFLNMHDLNPSIGRPSGIVPLNSSGKIASTYVDGDTLNLQTGNGLSGNGTASTPLVVSLSGDSLVFDGSSIKADTQDSVVSTSATKPLSANQGKLLQDQITSIGTGIVYKGAFDVISTTVSAASLGTLSAGMTVAHNGSSGTADASWGVGSVSNGVLLRYNGTAWQITASATSVLSDGSVDLAAAQKGATASADTGNASDGSEKKVATVEYVEDAIVNTNLDELKDCYVDDTTVAANDMIYYDGNSWEPIQLENTFTAGEKVVTTGSSVTSLTDVDTGATNGQVLQFNSTSGNFEPATISSTATDTIIAGAGNGSTNDHTVVNAAFGSSTFGYNSTTASGTGQVSFLNFTGRRFKVEDEITMPAKKQIRIENGTLELDINNNVDKNLIKPGTTTSLATTLSEAELAGSYSIKVGDASSFSIGDIIQIYSKPVFDLRNYNAPDTAVEFGVVHITKVTDIENNSTLADRISLEEPLPTKFEGASVVERRGEGTNGADQIENVVFENVTFLDQNSRVIYLNEADDSDGATPLGVTNGNRHLTVTLPSSHGLAVGSAVLIQDADLGGDGVNHIVPKTGDVNRWMIADTISTGDFTFTDGLGANTTGSTGSYGGELVYVVLSRHNGVHLKNATNVTFRNCKFKGWNGDHALKLEGCKNIRIENCDFSECRGPNYDVSGGGRNTAIHIVGSSDIEVTNCKFLACNNAIRFSSLSVTVDSSSVDFGSANITITDCLFNSANPINCERDCFVSGTTKITGCRFVPFKPNPNRIGCRYHYREQQGYIDGSYIYSGIDYVAEILNIDKCTFETIVEPAATFSSTAYWGNGNGYELYTGESNKVANQNARFGFYRGVNAIIHANPFKDSISFKAQSLNLAPSTIKNFVMTNCSVVGFNSGVTLEWLTPVTIAETTDGKTGATFDISNNLVAGSLYGIYARNGYDQINFVQSTGSTVNHNKIFNNWAAKKIPGLFNGATWQGGSTVTYDRDWIENDLRGIWIATRYSNTNLGARYYDLSVIGNSVSQVKAVGISNHAAQGILFGSSSGPAGSSTHQPNNTFNICRVTNNTLQGCQVGIYSYINNDSSGGGIFKRLTLSQNTSHGHLYIYNSPITIALNESTNNGINNVGTDGYPEP